MRVSPWERSGSGAGIGDRVRRCGGRVIIFDGGSKHLFDKAGGVCYTKVEQTFRKEGVHR